jgi:hypothetical protein
MEYSDPDAYSIEPWAEELFADNDDARPRQSNMGEEVLSSPLLTTGLWKIAAALGSNRHRDMLRSGCSLRESRLFLDLVESEGTTLRVQDNMTPWAQVHCIEAVLTSCSPTPINVEVPMMLYSSLASGLRSKGVELDDGSLSVQFTREAEGVIGSVERLRSAYDRCRARKDLTKTLRYNNMTLFITPYGFYAKINNQYFYAPLIFLAGILYSCELYSRFLVAYHVLCINDTPHVTPSMVMEVARWQWSVISRYGNKGYPIAKAPEAIFKTHASRLSGGDPTGVKPGWEKMADKYILKERALMGANSRMRPLTPVLTSLASSLTFPEEAVELSGLLHFCSFPHVDPVLAGVENRESHSAPIDACAAVEATWVFSHMILVNFVDKRGFWPPIRFSARGSELERLRNVGMLTISKRSYPLSDWENAVIHDIATFSFDEDYLSLLADKASCAGLEHRVQHYNHRLSPPTMRRLLARVLDSPEILTRQELDDFSCGELPNTVMAADLYPKECEYKPNARLYTILHPIIKRCFGLIQENVKSCIFQYFPYTSMAMSPQELHHALSSMTSGRQGSVVKEETDFASWNRCFTRGWMNLVGPRMDAMCGVSGLFLQSHNYFYEMEFCLTPADARNEALENSSLRDSGVGGPLLWGEDDGGREGIEQRAWTVCTAVMIYWALWDEEYEFTLLGQGDNQTLAIFLGDISADQLGVEIERLERLIETKCRLLGHEAKPEEFLSSLTILTYSKDFYLLGRRLAMEYKFAARVGPSLDELTPTFEDAIGSIFSSALGSARNSRLPLRHWLLALVHAVRYIRRVASGGSVLSPEYAAMARGLMSSRVVLGLALTASGVLGGMPVVSWSNFLWSHDPDPLTQAIAELKVHSWAGSLAMQAYLLDSESYTTRPNLRSLLDAPYSIPLRSEPMASTIIRTAAAELLGCCRNNAIRQLALTARQSEDDLLSCLTSQRPFFPLMAADLLDIAIVGRARKVVNKFKSTGTLFRMVNESNAWTQYERQALARCLSTVARLTGIAARRDLIHLPNIPSHELAASLRLRWGLGHGGIQGLEVLSPLDFSVLTSVGPGVLAIAAPNATIMSTGPHPAYIGSKTREKRSVSEYEVDRVPGIDDLKKLVLSATAGAISPSVRALYEWVCQTRCSLSLDTLIGIFPGTQGGTPAHRYESMSGGSLIGPVGCPSALTWVSINTSNIPGVSGSPADWPIALQSFMSYVAFIANNKIRRSIGGRVTRIHLSSSGLSELQSPFRDGPDPALRPIPPLRDNPLAHIGDLQVRQNQSHLGGTRVPISPADEVGRYVAGLCFVQLTARGSGQLSADRLGSSTSTIDYAAILAVPGTVLLQSLVAATVMSTIWHLSYTVQQESNRHHLDTVLDNLAGNAVQMCVASFSHPDADLAGLANMGDWTPGGGAAGFRAGADMLRRRLVLRARRSLSSVLQVADLYSYMILPEFVPFHPVGYLTRLRMSVLAWGWTIGVGNQVFGPAKTMIRRLIETYRRDSSSESLISAGALVTIRALSAAIGETLPRGVPHDVTILEATVLSPVQTRLADEYTMWKSLRTRRQPRVRVSPAESPEGGDFGTYTVNTSVASYTQGDLNFSRIIMTTPTRIWTSRLGRTWGRRSTVSHVWAGLFTTDDSPALVVGTGAGSIQFLLCSVGVVSEGLDLAESLPREFSTEPQSQPPECVGLPGASYAPEVFETSGDWFDSTVSRSVLRRSWSTVIVDIEQENGSRDYEEHILPLLENRYLGRVLVKMLVDLNELNLVYSRLRSARDIRHLRVHALSTPPTPSSQSPVAIDCFFRATSRLPHRAPLYTMTWSSGRTLPPDPRSTITVFRQALQYLSGGNIVADNVPDAIRECEDIVSGAVVSRGQVRGGTLLQVARTLVVLRHIQSRPLSRNSWARHFVHVPPDLFCTDRIWVNPYDNTVQYMLRKLVPRLLTCLID